MAEMFPSPHLIAKQKNLQVSFFINPVQKSHNRKLAHVNTGDRNRK